MNRSAMLRMSLVVCLAYAFGYSALAQQIINAGITDLNSAQTIPNRTFAFSGSLPGQPDGSLSLTFAIYADAQNAAPLWTETQVVQITAEKYVALLGSTTAAGLPEDIFSADQAHWLGVQVNGAEKRHLLVSVPYAMKAVEAERLGGLLPSDLVTVQQLQTALQAAGVGTSPQTKPGATGPGPSAAASGTPAQPATDFTDNNTSEVLLVTQQGTGFAIHAITFGQSEAILAQSDNAAGTALHALATSTTGQTIGLFAETASPAGIAGEFNSRAGGKILSLNNNGVEVASFNATGDLATNGQVHANVFVGDGSGLFNIPPLAVGASSANVSNAIVARDSQGSFAANQINANIFSGSGAGLFNIPPSAVGASSGNNSNSVVARDAFGSFAANQIFANNFFGNGFGLFNIPNSATTATAANAPNTIVARDASGNFAATNVFALGINASGQLVNTGVTDFSIGQATSPVHAVLSANAPSTCSANRELLIKMDAPAGQQLFICANSGSAWNLVGLAAGVSGISPTDGSIAIGGTSQLPSISVANGGITAAKLAPNAVTSVNIADGTLAPAKIAGTAATLGSNTFTSNQTIQQNLSVFGNVTSFSFNANNATINGSSTGNLATITQSGSGPGLNVSGGNTGISASGANTAIAASSTAGTGVNAQSTNAFGIFASSLNSTGIHSDGGAVGVDASSTNGVALQVRATGTSGAAIPATFTNSVAGKLMSGRLGAGPGFTESFSVDTAGNLFAGGALLAAYVDQTTQVNGPVKFVPSPSGNSSAAVAKTQPTDVGGAIGIAVGPSVNTGFVLVAYSGTALCLFDHAPTPGNYVGVSTSASARCTDLGAAYPGQGQQVLGRVIASQGVLSPVMLFGPEQHGGTGGTLISVKSGAGLTGGPITSAGTLSIADSGVTNTMLANPFVSVNSGTGLSGGGSVPLGGSITLNSTGVLSFNGRAGSVTGAPGDYSFAQIAGTVAAAQMPANTVYSNQSNTFTANQTLLGSLSASGNLNTSGAVAANSFSGASANFSGAAGQTAVLAVNDNGTEGFAVSVNSLNNPVLLASGGPTVLMAGGLRGPATTVLSPSGDLRLSGTATAQAFSGDGSALTNVSASKIGALAPADIATNAALTAETNARQSNDVTLQTSITAETTARQAAVTALQANIDGESTARISADAALQAGIVAETTSRQSDVSNLQTSINNVSSGDAKLATSNTFTAGTQDFSGAAATLPVRAVSTVNIPATCVGGKELLIVTDAQAGQQLFICNAAGQGWNLVGDGASGGVTAFNGRNGSVSPSSGDYSFSQISGSVAATQMPAFSGDASSSPGSAALALAPTGVAAGTYTKLTVDLKGRATNGAQAAFSDLAGSVTPAQLPVTVVYNNQANTLTGNQTVNGTLNATSFSGSGASLTGVNAAALNGLASGNFAQVGAANNFVAKQTLAPSSTTGASLNLPAGVAPTSPAIGDVWNTGAVLQYRDNASTTRSLVSSTQSGGMQMIKLTASITPASVGTSACTEQSFTISGISAGDVLLHVLQPSTSSPGTNIAIGGYRVSAANTVAIQFCNVGRNNASTPVSGTYTFAVMR